MEKINQIHIGTHKFYFEEKALKILENYIERIKELYKDNGEDLKVAEVEEKISTMCYEAVGDDGIVNENRIKEILDSIGLAINTEFTDESNTTDETPERRSEEGNTAAWQTAMLMGGKLFRDPHDNILGGVLSGIAKYYGLNTTLLRVLVFISELALPIPMLWIYIVLWIITPKAKSIIDFTRMRHVQENTAEAWKKNHDTCIEELKTTHSNGGCLRSLFLTFFYFMIIISLFIVIMFTVAFSSIFIDIIGSSLFSGTFLLAKYLFIIILCGIPIFALLHWIIRRFNNGKPIKKWIKAVLFIVWSITLAFVAIKCNDVIKEKGGYIQLWTKFRSGDFFKHLLENSYSTSTKTNYYCNNPIQSNSSHIYGKIWDKNSRPMQLYEFPFVIETRADNNGLYEIYLFDEMADMPNDYAVKYTIQLIENKSYEGSIHLYWDSINEAMYIGHNNMYTAKSEIIKMDDCTNLHKIDLIDGKDINTDNAKEYGLTVLELRYNGKIEENLNVDLYVDAGSNNAQIAPHHSLIYERNSNR